MAVVRAVSWCMSWCGEGTFAGITGTEHCSPTCACGLLHLSKGTDPEVCFSNLPECKSLERASLLGRGEGGGERCVNNVKINRNVRYN